MKAEDEARLEALLAPLKPTQQAEVKSLFARAHARERLPDERKSETFTFRIGDFQMYVHVGLYPDGRPGELFITTDKEGSFARSALDAAATSTSMALQYGAPLIPIMEKWRGMSFPPAGVTGDPRYPMVTSPLDYMARRLIDFFKPKEG